MRPNSKLTSYNLSFIAASLRPELARIVAENYLVAGDWNIAKERILSTNALQCRSASSAIRLERELRQRISALTDIQIRLLAQATAEDRAAIAWLAACKHIRFVYDFTIEILRDKLTSRDPVLRRSDYETFVENKSIAHPELAALTTSSKGKVRQILLLMLIEAGLLVKGEALGIIQRANLSPVIVHAITSDSPHWLEIFLIPYSEIPSRQTP